MSIAPPRYNHNAIEPHATIAFWKDDGSLVVLDVSQSVYTVAESLALIFRLKPENVQVIAPFVGGGFRRKRRLVEPHAALRGGGQSIEASGQAIAVARGRLPNGGRTDHRGAADCVWAPSGTENSRPCCTRP